MTSERVRARTDVELGFRFRHGWIKIGDGGGDATPSAPRAVSHADMAAHGKVVDAESNTDFDYRTVSMEHNGTRHYYRQDETKPGAPWEHAATRTSGRGGGYDSHKAVEVTHAPLVARLDHAQKMHKLAQDAASKRRATLRGT